MNFSTNPLGGGLDSAGQAKTWLLLLSATTLIGDEVCNKQDEKLGKIQDLMIDLAKGEIRYAVMSSGGFLGMGDRLFALPWKALTLDQEKRRFVLDVAIERLKKAPGFDKSQWPDMADPKWNSAVDSYFIQ